MKAPVLKTGESSGSVGSNPTSSSEEFVRRLGAEIYERMQTAEAGEAMRAAFDHDFTTTPLKTTDLVECKMCGRMTMIGSFCVCDEQRHVDGWKGKSGFIKMNGE